MAYDFDNHSSFETFNDELHYSRNEVDNYINELGFNQSSEDSYYL